MCREHRSWLVSHAATHAYPTFFQHPPSRPGYPPTMLGTRMALFSRVLPRALDDASLLDQSSALLDMLITVRTSSVRAHPATPPTSRSPRRCTRTPHRRVGARGGRTHAVLFREFLRVPPPESAGAPLHVCILSDSCVTDTIASSPGRVLRVPFACTVGGGCAQTAPRVCSLLLRYQDYTLHYLSSPLVVERELHISDTFTLVQRYTNTRRYTAPIGDPHVSPPLRLTCFYGVVEHSIL